jgi:ParB-like chromosome segregation protein Spo0J
MSAAIKPWREIIAVHAAAEMFPPMFQYDPEGFRALIEDVRKNGVREPVVIFIDERGNSSLIDGRNRLDALEAIGKEFNLNKKNRPIH